MTNTAANGRQWGDFQTPPELVAEVVQSLEFLGRWTHVLEPTCGEGNFIEGARAVGLSTREILGLDVSSEYAAQADARFAGDDRITISHADIFTTDLRKLPWRTAPEELLVLGNPPWVTSSEIASTRGSNLPTKTNRKGLRGIDAITGSSNFDIAETIIVRLLGAVDDAPVTLAMLCKPLVARNVVAHALSQTWPLTRASMKRIDAKRWFGASTDACLFIAELSPGATATNVIQVFDSVADTEPNQILEFMGGSEFADTSYVGAARALTGQSPIEWRQGVKHDCADVMELKVGVSGEFLNQGGGTVDIEPEYVFPLLKGSDLHNGRDRDLAVVVTQRKVGDPTAPLARSAPRLWSYLTSQGDLLDARRSRTYEGKPRFSMFGVGPYSFAPFKVAIASLYREIRPRLVLPKRGRPVMLDDTCYFLPCWSLEEACVVTALLKQPLANEFFRAMAKPDSKRVVTKKILQRLDLIALAQAIGDHRLSQAAAAEAASIGEDPAGVPDEPTAFLIATTGVMANHQPTLVSG